MPELVSGGPVIPVKLMNAMDNGEAVFFCGAGVSAGEGSELPTFAELVEHVYSEKGMKPDAVEEEALHQDEPEEDKRRPQLDKALELLERANRLGPKKLRRTVIKELSKPPTDDLAVHKALIALSRHGDDMRLVTTNFDRRFEEAEPGLKHIDVGPKLPIPRRKSWRSLVHLHGRINEDEDGIDLVLTAADFGRAYLTDRWAARFVTELFREFTVVFVGYSISDPVMSYMVDALAAERRKGAQFGHAYAFANHDGTDRSRAKAKDRWRAKNVEPILYEAKKSHQRLTNTLKKWADIQRDPLRARHQMALSEITKLPAGPGDPAVERVAWALEKASAARTLAEAPTVTNEDEFTKIGQWLECFSEAGLLQCPVGEAHNAGKKEDREVTRLVDRECHQGSASTLDATRRHLARWIAQHAHVPQVLTWVVQAGGCMNPELKSEIQKELGTGQTEIPGRLRFLWTVLLKQEPLNQGQVLWTQEHYKRAKEASERSEIEDEVAASLRPHLKVFAGPSQEARWKRDMRKRGTIPPIEACGHVRLVAGNSDQRRKIEPILENPDFLERHAPTFSRHLERAVKLAKKVEDIPSDSSEYRTSIAPDRRSKDNEGWMILIDLTRDGYDRLVGKNRARADSLLREWALSTETLFTRIALHALTENQKSDISLARKLLIEGRQPGLWRNELRREVLRFLRRAGARLPRALRAEVVRATHGGPKRRSKKPGTSDAKTIRHEIGPAPAQAGRIRRPDRQAVADTRRRSGRNNTEEGRKPQGIHGPNRSRADTTRGTSRSRPSRGECTRHSSSNRRRGNRRKYISEVGDAGPSEGWGCSGRSRQRRTMARSTLARAAVGHATHTKGGG